MRANKDQTINKNRQAIAGVEKHFASTPSFVLDGLPTTPKDVIATLKAAIDALQAHVPPREGPPGHRGARVFLRGPRRPGGAPFDPARGRAATRRAVPPSRGPRMPARRHVDVPQHIAPWLLIGARLGSLWPK